MERIVKGIWIPIEIWQATDISWNEKVLLMEIDSFTQKGKDCYISNRYIADMFGVSERTARDYLSHLIDAGYVRLVKFDGRARYVESALPSLPGRVEENFQAEWKKTSRQSGRKLPPTINIIDLNKGTDKKEIYKERTPHFDFRKALLNAGVSPETADAWLAVRKAKRSVNTEIAWNSTLNEIRKSGQSPEDCIREAVARSWAGFKAEWLQREQAGAPMRPRKVDNVTYMVEQHRQWLEEQRAKESGNPQDDLPDIDEQ